MQTSNRQQAPSTPFAVTQITMSRLLSQQSPANAIALYVFLVYTAQRQQTQSTYATEAFIARGLKWSRAKVGRVKQQLAELGLVESIVRRDAQGRVAKHFLRVRFSAISPDAQNPDAQNTTSGEMSAKMLIDKNGNALREKEMLPQRGKSSASENQPPDEKRLAEFLQLWNEAYQEEHGGRRYVPTPRDCQRSEKLLAASDLLPSQLVGFAREAWRHPADFHCKRAADIPGFCESFNGIMTAIEEGNAPVDVHGRKIRAKKEPARRQPCEKAPV